MNIVVVAEKKFNKVFEICLKNENHNLLGYETEMKPQFSKRIAEHYNPHVLVVVRGYKSKNYDFFAEMEHILEMCPTLRIIYFFGKVSKENEQDYEETIRAFAPFGMFDILPYDVCESGFKLKFLNLLNKPMTFDDLENIVEKLHHKEENIEKTVKGFERIADTTPVVLDKDKTENTTYDPDHVEVIDMLPEKLISDDNVTIGIASVSEKQTGCTLTAFEIAIMLKEAKQSTALFLDSSTYNNYIAYHGIENAPQGCEINGLTIYPIEMYNEKKLTLKFSICDFGTTPTKQSGNNYDNFVASEIKICICSFNEWDINLLADWLNSSLPYIKEINYVFFPVSQLNFVRFSKQMTKGHCKSYRIKNSPDYTDPCDWNKNVYAQILKQYVNFDFKKRRFGFLGR